MVRQGRNHPVRQKEPGGPPTFYFVEFDSAKWMDEVIAISPDWLESVPPTWVKIWEGFDPLKEVGPPHLRLILVWPMSTIGLRDDYHGEI